MAPSELACRICSARAEVLARPAPWTFARCRACGTYFVEPMPAGDAVDDADDLYTRAYYGGSERADESRFESATLESSDARMRSIERALGRRGRLLDVGCGTGYLLAAAQARGWEVVGVEVSARAAAFARETHGVEVTVGTLASAGLEPSSVDAVTLVHVLEHVPHPLALLGDVRRVLRADGALAVAIPNPRALIYAAYNAYHLARMRYRRDRYSCSLYPPSHLYAWDVAALRRLLERAGFRVVEITVTGKGDPQRYPVVDWGSGAVARAKRLVEGAGRAVGRGSIIECIAHPR